MKIKIMLDEGAKMPTRAHNADAGLDLYATKDFVVPSAYAIPVSIGMNPGTINTHMHNVNVGCAVCDTGVHVQIPFGYVGFVKSKSGLNVKFGLTGEGVIDSGYTGSIVVKLYNHTAKKYEFKKGDKIAQLVLLPIISPDLELVDSFEETERGNGGFGSSGR
jgi:dUTP pyrophosphatase